MEPQSESSPRDTATTADDGVAQSNRLPSEAEQGQGKDEFLMPGPTSTTNEGTARWAVSWIGFSLVLMLFMLLITLLCFAIARLVGLA